MENWKPVVGYEGTYEVSDAGNVRRVGGRILKLSKGGSGYHQVGLWMNNKGKIYSIHRLVCSAFLGPIGDKEVNHKNGNKVDNRVENLEVITRSENHRHAYRVLGRKPTRMIGTTNYQTLLSEDDVREIRRLKLTGISKTELAMRYCISRGAVGHIIKRRSWKHI